jgi:hypothetical protein
MLPVIKYICVFSNVTTVIKLIIRRPVQAKECDENTSNCLESKKKVDLPSSAGYIYFIYSLELLTHVYKDTINVKVGFALFTP